MVPELAFEAPRINGAWCFAVRRPRKDTPWWFSLNLNTLGRIKSHGSRFGGVRALSPVIGSAVQRVGYRSGEAALGDDEVHASGSWTRHGKVRARADRDGALELEVEGLTTQAKYYKPLLKDFFRLHFHVRPRWGDWSAHIAMEFTGDPPHMDLDNLAKAMLDSAVGSAFHDDSQIARLLVERRRSDREGVWMRLEPIDPVGAP